MFVAAGDERRCLTENDGDPRTVETVKCRYPEAIVYYVLFRDRIAADAQFGWWAGLSAERHASAIWLRTAGRRSGRYARFIWNGRATLAWQVEGTLFGGFAYGRDDRLDALGAWWQATGNRLRS